VDPGGACRGPAGAVTWSVLERRPTVFGLDYFTVTTKEPVVIDSVQLIGGAGGLRLVDAWFVPAGHVGVFDDSGASPVGAPSTFANRISMPDATLAKLVPTATELSSDPSAAEYQLVVGVVPTKDISSAAAARITYRVDGKTGHVTGSRYLAVTHSQADTCGPTPTGPTS
jgi:hypothetical protein